MFGYLCKNQIQEEKHVDHRDVAVLFMLGPDLSATSALALSAVFHRALSLITSLYRAPDCLTTSRLLPHGAGRPATARERSHGWHQQFHWPVAHHISTTTNSLTYCSLRSHRRIQKRGRPITPGDPKHVIRLFQDTQIMCF